MSNPPSSFTFCVNPTQSGNRLDSLVADKISNCSRSFAATLIRGGHITVDGANKKPGYQVKNGEIICGSIPAPEVPCFMPEAIPLQILYNDADLLVINKAPGMVVHPAPGHSQGTLANALMHHCPDLEGISGCLRPGIVHRLDKDTSGIMVVAKNNHSMHHLADQFKSRQVRKYYLAMVYGIPETEVGSVDLPIGRHPLERKKMSVRTNTPRSALTLWRVREKFDGACLLELDIRTGRTHQIRVHCQSIGHPVIGDPLYGNRGAKKQLAQKASETAAMVEGIGRQMLHAWRIHFIHPVSGDLLSLQAPLPADMAGLIACLRDKALA